MPVYDDEKEKTDVGTPGDEELRRLTGISEREEAEMDQAAGVGSEEGGSFFNKDGDSDSVASKERSAGTGSGDGLYNKRGDDPKQLGGLRGLYGRLRNRRNQLVGSVRKHKWLWGLGGGALASVMGFIFMLFILLAALKIPHLAENITAYQFARVFQQSAETNERVTSEKLAVDAADQGIYGKLKAKYDAAGSKVSDQWSKLDKYQPNKVIANMDESGTLKFNYKQTAWGGQKIAGITMGNTTMLTKSTTTLQKLLPGYDFIKGLSGENISLVQQYQNALKEGFRAQEVGPITRGLVAKEIRQRLGISLTAWAVAKYKNLSEQKAALQEARDANAKINTPDPNEPTTASVKNATDAVEEAEKETIADDGKLTKTLDNNGVMNDVEAVANKSVASSGFDTALGVANPAYAIATPACIVFDGSLDHSGSSIDSNVNAQEKEYQYVASAADQQKDGTNATENAVGALNNRLGDYSESAPIERASHNTSYVPLTTPSAEASSMGTFTILSALLGGGKAVDVVNKMAGGICPALTNVYAASGIAILNIIATIFTLGGAEGAEEGVLQTVRLGVEKAATKVVDSVTTKAGAKLAAGKTASFLGDSLKTGVKIAGVTLAAKAIVMAKSGYANNGIDTGNDTANNADSGGNLMANEIEREQFYGRPLDKNETNSAGQQSMQLVYSQNQSQSAYQRYFALSNYHSMLSVVGTSMLGSMHNFSISSFFSRLGDTISSPMSLFSGAILQTNHSLAFAANSYNTDQLNHGNVQFGWSAEETALAKQPAYSMLENQRTLDASGQEDAIASAYGKCFDGGTSIGTLLQDPGNGIARDDNGNVEDNQGTCSPQNLGPHNPQYGDKVFRWRLAQRDNNGLDTVLDEQTITADTTAETTSSFKIASYNVLGEAHASGNWRQRLSDVEGVITGHNIDIVGLQELEAPQRAALLNDIGSTFDIYPDQAHYPSTSSPNSIIWDKSKFKLVDSGTQPNLKYFNNSDLNAPWIELQDLNTNQQFIVMNTHDPAHSDAQDTFNRYQNALEHVKFIQSMQSKNVPILYTGDFNSGYELSSANPTYQNVAQNMTYCIMGKGGLMQDTYDAANNRQFKCPNPALGNAVDHIYVSKGVEVASYQYITGNIGTDHRGVPSAVVCLGSCSNTGSGSHFRIASYNMRVGTTPAQNQTAIDNMQKYHFDIVGMQELSHADTFNTVKTKLNAAGYDIYPQKYTGTWEMNSTAITWNTSQFSLYKTSSVTYPAGDKASPARIGAPTTSPIVWLKDKTTGQGMIVMNVHTFAFGKTAAYDGPELRHEAAQAFTNEIQSLQSEHLPILLTGDFNEGYGTNATAYCMLETRNLMVSPFVDNPADYCKTGGKQYAPMGGPDHILTSPGIQGTANQLVGQPPRGFDDVFPNLGTDHQHVPYSDIVIPGSSSGTSSNSGNQDAKNGWQWPLTKAEYNGLSQCFAQPVRGQPGHTGIDLRAGVGTPVYAAHDGTVVQTDPSGRSDGGKYIILKNGNGLYSNYQHNSQILVKVGQQVKAGDKISLSGNTGYTTGPHLHFSITTKPGLDSRFSVAYSVDPIPYLPNDRNTSPCQ